jgi:hypothetical protein
MAKIKMETVVTMTNEQFVAFIKGLDDFPDPEIVKEALAKNKTITLKDGMEVFTITILEE